MAVFQRIDPRREGFVYRGWVFGLVPVYVGPVAGVEAPNVTVRNWIPEWTLDLGEALFAAFCWVAPLARPDFEPSIPIKLTGRLDGARLVDDTDLAADRRAEPQP